MPHVRLQIRPDHVAVLIIDQPDSRANVLGTELWTALGEALDALPGDIRGLVIASAKPGIFIAGADLKLLGEAPTTRDPAVRAFIEHGLRVLEKLAAVPAPTCAAIDGAALGGGLEVALTCDARLVGTHPKVQLGLPEVNLGLVPGWGGTQRLPRLVGLVKAAGMLTTGTSVNADAAVAMGLAAAKVESAAILDAAAAKVLTMTVPTRADKPEPLPAAVREVLTLLIRGADLPLTDAIALETEAFQRLAGSADSKQRIAAFFAARAK